MCSTQVSICKTMAKNNHHINNMLLWTNWTLKRKWWMNSKSSNTHLHLQTTILLLFSNIFFALNRYIKRTSEREKKELHELRVSGCQINVQYRSVFMYENQDLFSICMQCMHTFYICNCVCARNKSKTLETTEREINRKKHTSILFSICCSLREIMCVRCI